MKSTFCSRIASKWRVASESCILIPSVFVRSQCQLHANSTLFLNSSIWSPICPSICQFAFVCHSPFHCPSIVKLLKVFIIITLNCDKNISTIFSVVILLPSFVYNKKTVQCRFRRFFAEFSEFHDSGFRIVHIFVGDSRSRRRPRPVVCPAVRRGSCVACKWRHSNRPARRRFWCEFHHRVAAAGALLAALPVVSGLSVYQTRKHKQAISRSLVIV